ncbi:MAG: hypothetical protein ACK4YQ_10835 [Phenylobacterium sp.]|uniref:hypothetical protein n=1 Tax=Phenylobacterium sp. TaxID=1871053 RepID=UPI00391CEE08
MDYRLIILSSSGETADMEQWTCPSDVEAAERASRRSTSFGSELWRGDERIGVYAGRMRAPADPAPQQPAQ